MKIKNQFVYIWLALLFVLAYSEKNSGISNSSFIQTSSEMMLESASQTHMATHAELMEYMRLQDRGHFQAMALAQVGAARRSTTDGRKCASQYQDMSKKIINNNCVTTKAPNGKVDGKEWCKVDPKEGGSPDWGYCTELLDYDKARLKAIELLKAEVPEIRKINTEMKKVLSEGVQLLKTNTMGDAQETINTQEIEELVETFADIQKAWDFTKKLRLQWQDLETKILVLKEELNELRKINEKYIPENCEGLLGYEFETEGDGLDGYFYNNENYDGTPLVQDLKQINFDWQNQSPISGINHENYAARFEGYIKAPVTSNYVFTSYSDDGAQLWINEQLILTHKFGSHFEEGKGRSWMDAMQLEKDSAKVEIQSKLVQLKGGVKYKLKYMIYHTVHNSFEESRDTFAKLKWRSDLSPTRTIIPKDFYKLSTPPPLQVYGYNSKQFELVRINNNELAFKNNKFYIIDDVPLKYQNLPMLRTNKDQAEKEFSFGGSQSFIMYIAIDANKENLLPDEFLYTQTDLTVLRIPVPKPGAQPEYVIAKESYRYMIYEKNFDKGDSKFLIQYTNKSPNFNMIMFYALDTQAAQENACGGVEEMISLPSSEAYESCQASSQFPTGQYNCDYAFSGSMTDVPMGIWASNGQGVAAWLRINFKKEYQITKILYKDRDNSYQRNKRLSLTFSDGQSIKEDLKNTEKIQRLKAKAFVTKEITFTVEEVYTTINNGMALQIWGIPCTTQKGQVMLEPSTKVHLKCRDSLINNVKIQKRLIRQGDKFLAFCSTACIEETMGDFWGSLRYSSDSAICRAAFHAGAISPLGGDVIVKVEAGLPNYQGSNRNGLLSSTKLGSLGRTSISFEKYEDINMQILNSATVGMQVDVLDPVKNVWMPGSIDSIDRPSLMQILLMVKLDGYGPEFNVRVRWPDFENVNYCGEVLSDRVCDIGSKRPNSKQTFQAKICFTPLQSCVEGYHIDNGYKFGSKGGGLVYGWSREMSQLARIRGPPENQQIDPEDPKPPSLLDAFVMFPPDPQNPLCKKKNPDVSCDPADWSIKVPVGKYLIKITVGDKDVGGGYSLYVNDSPLITGTILKPDQFFSDSLIVDATQGVIKIAQKCNMHDIPQGFCVKVWSRINAITIEQYIELPPAIDGEDENGTKSMGCGNSFKNGRCTDGTNPENCVYERSTSKGSLSCSGVYQLVNVPMSFECKDQRGMVKCVKKEFDNLASCKKTCPGKCLENKCIVPNSSE